MSVDKAVDLVRPNLAIMPHYRLQVVTVSLFPPAGCSRGESFSVIWLFIVVDTIGGRVGLERNFV